jgi:hypothetical protein
LVRTQFAAWLEHLGLPSDRVENLSGRLDSYFTIAVHNEWRSDPKSYEPIHAALETPLLPAAEQELAWLRYSAHIAQMVDEPVFGESFSLRQIYIYPRGYVLGMEIPVGDRHTSKFRTRASTKRPKNRHFGSG